MRAYKLNAGALQLVVFIMVLVALMLSGFILFIHTQRQFQIQQDFVKTCVQDSEQGIVYALENAIPLHDTLYLKLYGEDRSSLKVYRGYWGIYEQVVSHATIKHKRFTKVALLGRKPVETHRPSLYLKEHNKPLVVVGTTKIQGIAYVPKRGVRTGNIAGHSYYGDQLIYGPEHTITKFPELTEELKQQLDHLENLIVSADHNQFLELQPKAELKNSFLEPLKVIYSPQELNLSQVHLTGHFLVQSDTKIVVESTALLQDVLLIAPEITIEDHVRGVFQAFATEHISLGFHCQLGYPSALVLQTKSDKDSKEVVNGEPQLLINENSSVKGVVMYLGSTVTTPYEAQLLVESQSFVHGEVYCEANLELKGAVYGSVYTDGFVAKANGSNYQNHIYNGQILIDSLPPPYGGLALKGSDKTVTQWLY